LFADPRLALPNNPVVAPNSIGVQGLTDLGLGRVSPNSNIGGFVFSLQSSTVSLLLRALQTQQRVEILSRPQVMTMDNQTAFINIGQEIPIVTQSTLSATGLAQQNIDRRQVGVQMTVTPKVLPDGRVLMRIIPEVSSVIPTPVQLGNGTIGTALNIQRIETTVLAGDGETVVLGGMIQKSDSKNENRVPWWGELPGVGALFRVRTQQKKKTELVVIMTPHVVRCQADADYIWQQEARKMDWTMSDVVKLHGTAPPIGPLPTPMYERHLNSTSVPPVQIPPPGTQVAPPGSVPPASIPPGSIPPGLGAPPALPSPGELKPPTPKGPQAKSATPAPTVPAVAKSGPSGLPLPSVTEPAPLGVVPAGGPSLVPPAVLPLSLTDR
jgi:hypothetical protein